MHLRPQIREHSVIVVGSINPAILQPAWLSSKQLIREAEAHEADIEVIHKEVSEFDIGWLKLTATTNRIQLTTEQEPYFEATRDLMIGILSILEHTPISGLGINWGNYYSFPNRSEFDRFGHAIAPKHFWSELLEPRTSRVSITSRRKDAYKGSVNATISPRDRLPFCAHLYVNDHFDIEGDEGLTSTEAVARLSECWSASKLVPDQVANRLFEGMKE